MFLTATYIDSVEKKINSKEDGKIKFDLKITPLENRMVVTLRLSLN